MVVPLDIPVTIPLELIVPTEGLLLLQLPPMLEDESVISERAQTFSSPVIGLGSGFTVAMVVLIHPVLDSLYVIVAVPLVIPVKTPVVEPIVAIAGVLLLHVPDGDHDNVVDAPTQTMGERASVPGGIGFTGKYKVSLQPAPDDPEAIEVTTKA